MIHFLPNLFLAGYQSFSSRLPPLSPAAMAAGPAASFPAIFFPSTGNKSTAAPDDDDEFGDFEFALPPRSVQPISSTATTSIVAAFGEGEDEWGDFVDRPIPRSDSPSSVKQQQQQQPRWERSKGAIPLSIFGEVEEEVQENGEEQDPPSGSGDLDSISSSPGHHGADSDGKDPFFNPGVIGGLDSAGKDSIFSVKAEKTSEGVAIRDLLDDLYGIADDSKVVSGNVAAVVTEEVDDDFEQGGWEFKCAVAVDDEGSGDVGSVQVAKENMDCKKDILQLEVGTSKQELNNGSIQHNTITNSFDLFSDITHAVGYSENQGLNAANGLITNMMNGDASSNERHNSVKHATFKAGVLDPFQWKEVHGEDDVHTNGKDNLLASEGEFQDFGEFLGSHMEEDVTMPQSNIEKQDPDSLLDAQSELFAFDQSSAKSGAKDKMSVEQHVPSSCDLLLDTFVEYGQDSSFDVKKSRDKDRNLSIDMVFNNVNSENDLHDGHLARENGFLERDEGQTIKIVNLLHAQPTPENPVDFYSRSKEMSCFLAFDHIHDLKKVHELAVLSNDETEVKEHHLQIEAAYTKLQLKDEDSKNVAENKHCNSNVSCDQLLENLKHPKLQEFEMEYSLSEKIKLAQSDLTCAVQLFEHSVAMLYILQLGSPQQQLGYITAWPNMLSVCEQELHHGTTILAQSLHTGVREKILSEPKGRDYFLALGEIYTATEILNTTLTIYKPWIMSNPVDRKDSFAIVRRCFKLWMDAGLREALEDSSAQADGKSKAKIKRIFESIDAIHNLDAATIQIHMASLKEPICHLSLLPLGMLPDMDVVAWNGEKYLAKLANLWVNLISSDFPKLSFDT